MFKKLVLFSAVVTSLAGTSSAQSLNCSTDEHYHELLARYPELAIYEKQFEAQMSGRALRTTAATDTTTYDVPLVVHVVHDYGAENLNDDVVFDAVKYWAVVFMKQNADTNAVISPFIPYIGNPKVRLHLATKDPAGNPTKGIVKHFSYLTGAGGDQAKYESWPNNQYINVWLIKSFDASHASAAAYAYYPSSGAAMPYYDGVIGLATYVNYQKTIPHELGHVLNLAHTWGSTNSPGVACGDDGVADTPPTKGHTSCSSTDLYDVTCAIGNADTFTAALGGDSIVNYPDTVNAQNIMDYSYCELMFTHGQATRMRNTLTASVAGRNNLITASNLNATGALAPRPDLAPKPEFIVNKASSTTVITDPRNYFLTFNNEASFVFRNASWNDTITGVSWTFSNGATIPTSTSSTTVTNKFSTPGWVTVGLTATSNAGSTTLTDNQAVYVADTAAINLAAGYMQNFASTADISNWPMFNYYKNQFKWEFYTGAGVDDNSCVRFRSFDNSARRYGTAVGDFDDFMTPAFNLSDMSGSLYFNFYTAGASTNTGLGGWGVTKVDDSLEVWASTSGGARWTKIGGYKSSDLANNGVKSSEYVTPTATEWKGRSISIPVGSRSSNTFFRFRYRPGNTGNNLYLDKVHINPNPTDVQDVLSAGSQFNIFPNPATSNFNIAFNTGANGNVAFCIKDLTGKVILGNSKSFAAGTLQQVEVARSAMPSAGLYFVTVTIDGVSSTQKLVVY